MRNMIAAQRSETDAVVLLGVLRIAHAPERAFHQPDHRGEDLLARQAGASDVLLHLTADARQCLAEGEHVGEFGFVAQLAPARVVDVLLAPSRIATHGLDVAVRIGADPHARPCRRNAQRLEARERVGIADDPTVGIAVDEAFARAVPRDPGRAIADITELRDLGGDERIEGRQIETDRGAGGRFGAGYRAATRRSSDNHAHARHCQHAVGSCPPRKILESDALLRLDCRQSLADRAGRLSSSMPAAASPGDRIAGARCRPVRLCAKPGGPRSRRGARDW
jgi:hypothetical protein